MILPALAAAPPRVEAHGIGGPTDLPLPLDLTVAAAVAALTLSFTVLALAWQEPRYDPPTRGRALPRLQRVVESPAYRWLTRAAGLAGLGWLLLAALAGQDLLTNPVFGMVYVLVWVGLVPASLLLGPVYRTLSPVRTLHAGLARVVRVDPEHGLLRLPRGVGYWPAAGSLAAFTWLELVSPTGDELGTLRAWVLGYLAVMLLGALVFGRGFLARADPFEVYSTLVAHLSVWGRREGRLVLASPLANLATLAPAPGLLATVAVLFGSTAFDSFRESTAWLGVVQPMPGSAVPVNTLALLSSCVVAGVVFAAACLLTGRAPLAPRLSLPSRFAHSLVPIVVGYMTAHYLTYLVEQGQLTVIQMSDPLSRGDDLLGTGALGVNVWLSYHPSLLAVLKVLAVVLGHVVGAVAAHDRALALLPPRSRLTGQLPLLVVMVCLTASGLYLLFAG